MSDLLFIKTSSLGDVVHHMPAVTDLRRARPEVRIAWMVEEDYVPLVRLHPGVDAVVPVAFRRWRRNMLNAATWREARAFWRAAGRAPYERVIDSQGLVRSALLGLAVHGRRHGYDRASIREAPAAAFYHQRHTVSRALHAIERNRALTAAVIGYRVEGAPDYGLEPSRPAGAPYAVLLHGTANAAKEWPEPDWARLAAALEGAGLDLVLPWGSAAERQRSVRLAASLKRASVPERAPLDQVARMLAGASLVVGVDTGLVHLAAALQVPVVAVFLASDPSLTGPRGMAPIRVLGSKGAAPDANAVIAAALGGTPKGLV